MRRLARACEPSARDWQSTAKSCGQRSDGIINLRSRRSRRITEPISPSVCRRARLTAPRGPWFCAPGRDRLFGEPHRQAATLAQGSIIFQPVRYPILLLRNVVTAIGIGLEWHDGHLRGVVDGGSTLPLGTAQADLPKVAICSSLLVPPIPAITRLGRYSPINRGLAHAAAPSLVGEPADAVVTSLRVSSKSPDVASEAEAEPNRPTRRDTCPLQVFKAQDYRLLPTSRPGPASLQANRPADVSKVQGF